MVDNNQTKHKQTVSKGKAKTIQNQFNMIEKLASIYAPKYSIPQYFSNSNIFDRFKDSIELYYSSDLVSQSIDYLISAVLRSIVPDMYRNEKLKFIVSDADFRESLRDVALSYYTLCNAFGLIYYKKVRLSKKTVYVPIIAIIPPDLVQILGPTTNPIYGVIYPIEVVLKFKEYLRSGKYKEYIESLGLNQFFERPATKEDYEPIMDLSLRRTLERNMESVLIVKKDKFFAVRTPSFSRYAEPFLAKLLSKVEMLNLVPTAKASFYAGATLTILLLKVAGTKSERDMIVKSFFNEIKSKDSKVVSIAVPPDTEVDFQSGWKMLTKDIGIGDVEYFVDLIIKEILGTGIEDNFEELQQSIFNRVNQFVDVLNKIVTIASEKNNIEPETVSELKTLLKPVDFKTLLSAKQQALLSASTVLSYLGTSVEKEIEKRKYENEIKFEETLIPKFQPYQGKYSVLKENDAEGDD